MMSQRVAKAALHRCLRKSCLSNPCAIGRNYSVVIHAARTRTRTGSAFLQNHTNGHHRSHSRDLSSYGGAGGTVEMEDLQDLSDNNDEDAYQYYPNRSASMDDIEAEERKERMRQAVRDEIDTRTGRLWEDPWALTDDDWSSGKTFDDLPDWTEEICSRVSRERVKVHPDGVPTLDKLANLSLPPSHPEHPALGNPKPYVKHRKDAIRNTIYAAVEKFAKPKMEGILSIPDDEWDKKQNAIDDLFEQVHAAVVKKDKKDDDDYLRVVIGSMPNFPTMVERALEDYLRKVAGDEKRAFQQGNDAANENENDAANTTATATSEDNPLPVFMDLMKSKDASLDEAGVPKLLYPLKSHPHDGPGRMIEEWELSANGNTKRIMGRQCISDIARALDAAASAETSESDSRVFVTGRKGTGKSASLAAIVASARLSGHIVLYLPDGDRLRKHGFYVEPNNHRKIEGGSDGKLFDLPVLSKEVCGQLYESHSEHMEDIVVTKDTLNKSLSEDQFKKFSKKIETLNDDGDVAINELLKLGSDNVGLASACYSAAIDTLMEQSSIPFTMVIDQYNCFYDHGQYFHGDYDPTVEKAIPLHKITLFQPLVDAMGIEKTDDGKFISKEPTSMKRGGIVVGIAESYAVARHFTADLTKAVTESGANIIEVPQYSPLEVDHVLANFEIIGLGRLRFDRGATVMNKQEVAYLRMVSGGVGQPLLDACVH